MKFLNMKIDRNNLLTKQQLLEHLEENGGHDRGLSEIRDRYLNEFGNELMWRYPITDGWHNGVVIVTVREGFISLPYDFVDNEVYEIFELEKAAMFDAESMEIFLDDWKSFSEHLTNAMTAMLKQLQQE